MTLGATTAAASRNNQSDAAASYASPSVGEIQRLYRTDEAVESGISITLYEFEDEAQVVDNFMAGLCDIVATDGTGRILAQVPSGQEWVRFPRRPVAIVPQLPA